MKNIKSNQTQVFKRKNALRQAFGSTPKFASGGVVQIPPTLGNPPAAAPASMSFATPAPSITAPPPPPAPVAPGKLNSVSGTRVAPNNDPLLRPGMAPMGGAPRAAAGLYVNQSEPTADVFVPHAPQAAHGTPSALRLGAAGVPGIPPAFDAGGVIGNYHKAMSNELDAGVIAPPPAAPAAQATFMNKLAALPVDMIAAAPGRNKLDTRALLGQNSAGTAQRMPGDPIDAGFAIPSLRAAPSPYVENAQIPEVQKVMRGFAEGGPIGDERDPPKQGPDKEHIVAAEGEYILPKATVDALGGPDAVDQMVRETNGKEPNHTQAGSTLRHAAGGLPVLYDPVQGQRFAPPNPTYEPVQPKATINPAADFERGMGPQTRTMKTVHNPLRPSGLGMRMLGGTLRATGPIAAAGYLGATAKEVAGTPTSQYMQRFGQNDSPKTDNTVRNAVTSGVLRNAPLLGPVLNAFVPQTPSGNEAVNDIGVRAAGAASDLANPFNVMGYKDKGPTSIKKTKIIAPGEGKEWDHGTLPAATKPAAAQQGEAPSKYKSYRSVMDGVDPTGLFNWKGAGKNFGKMLQNASALRADAGNNKMQLERDRMDWDRQKFGLEQQWAQKKYGFDYSKDMNESNRKQLHDQVDKLYPLADKDGNPIKENALLNQYAKGTLDNTAGGAGGYHKLTQGDLNESLVQTTRAIQELQNRSGVMGAVKNLWHGGEFRMPATAADMLPNAPMQVGTISTTAPTAAGPVAAGVVKGDTNLLLPGTPARMQDVENINAVNALRPVPANAVGGRVKSYAKGGRVSKSGLRKGPC